MAKSEQEILAGLAEIVNEETGLEPEEVQMDKSFTDDLDIDSLSMMTIVVNAEDKFGVRIPDDEVKNLTHVKDAVTYIANNVAAIADYAARWDHGEIISTAFAESTVDLVVSRRFAKKQQIQWSKQGAHLLLQTRTRTLDGTLHDLFTSWYPAMPANDGQPLPLAAAA